MSSIARTAGGVAVRGAAGPQSTVQASIHRGRNISTKPAPFDLQGINDNDLIDYTPALKERARAIARHYVMGPVFTRHRCQAIRPAGP